jgi:hypothetical protein
MEMLAGPAGRPQPNLQIIREDVVERIGQPQQIGVVAKVAGDPADTFNGEQDGDGDWCIPEGSAIVVWLNSKSSTENVNDVSVLDRAFLHGDVVAAVADPLGQTGIVIDVAISVNLQLPNGEIVEGIDSRRLRRVSLIPLLHS